MPASYLATDFNSNLTVISGSKSVTGSFDANISSNLVAALGVESTSANIGIDQNTFIVYLGGQSTKSQLPYTVTRTTIRPRFLD